jgi:hypothetical protein
VPLPPATTTVQAPTTTVPGGLVVRHERVATDATVGQITSDGRYVVLDAVGGPRRRYERSNGQTVGLVYGNQIITDDGLTEIGYFDGRYYVNGIGTGISSPLPAPPDRWWTPSVNYNPTSASADGRIIAVNSFDLGAGPAVIVLDRESGQWSRVDGALASLGPDNDSSSPLLSSNGDIIAFVHRTETLRCDGCTSVWVGPPDDLRLASPGSAGSVPTDGEVRLVDLSADGRFTLFWSNSTDLALDDVSAPSGRYYLFDAGLGTTTRLPITPWRIPGTDPTEVFGDPTMSDDATRFAFLLGVPPTVDNGVQRRSTVPVVFDRTTGITTSLEPPGVAVYDNFRGVLIDGAGDDVTFALNPMEPFTERWVYIAHLE